MLYCKCSIKLKNKKPEEDLKCVKRRDQNPCRKPQSGRHEGGRLSEKQGYNVAQSDYNPLEIQLEVLKSKPDFLIISEITEFPYELCKNLKGACPKLKIIMLSNRKTNNGNNGLAKYADMIIKVL